MQIYQTLSGIYRENEKKKKEKERFMLNFVGRLVSDTI